MKKTKYLGLLALIVLVATMVAVLTLPVTAAASQVKDDYFSDTGLDLTLGEDYAYSFAVVGDTQTLNYNDIKQGTDNMSKMYQWILDNQSGKNIQFVLGLGDITDQHYNDINKDGTKKSASELINDRGWNEVYANDPDYNEWYHAMKAVSLLNGKIDYSLVRGNHDDASHHTKYIDQYNASYRAALNALVAQTDEFGKPMAGFYNDGLENSYRKETINGVKYMIITLDVGQDDSMLAWLDGVLDEADELGYKAIITLHEFLNTDSSILDTSDTSIIPSLDGFAVPNANDPRELWELVLRKHASVHMILSGHISSDDIKYSQVRGDNGNTVTQMLIDPQHIDLTDNAVGGNVGMVAMFYFSADGSVVNVEYISTIRATDNNDATGAYLCTNSWSANSYVKREFGFALELDYEWVNAGAYLIPKWVADNTQKYPFVTLFDDDNNPDTANPFLGAYSSLIDNVYSYSNETGSTNESGKPLYGAFVENVGRVKVGGASSNVNKNLVYLLTRDFDTKNGGDIHGYYKLIGQLTGKHTLDLNGHTFTLAGENLFAPSSLSRTDTYAPTYNITNGNIVVAGGGSIFWLGNNTCPLYANLKDVNVSYASTATNKSYIVRAYEWAGSTYPTDTNIFVTVDGCTFDFKANVPAGYNMFYLTHGDIKNESVDLTVKNSKILMNSVTEITGFNIATYDENDKVNVDGLLLETPALASSAAHPTSNFVLPEGNRTFCEIARNDSVSTYELQNITSDIGTIPQEYLSVVDYPFVSLWWRDAKSFGAYADSKWLDGNSGIVYKALGNVWGDSNKRHIFVRKDYEIQGATWNNFGQYAGYTTIDLGGHTLTGGNNCAILPGGIKGKNNKSSYNTEFHIYNGTILLKNKGLIDNYTAATDSSGWYVEGRKFSYYYEGINIGFAEGATSTNRVLVDSASHGDTNTSTTYSNVYFNNCNFDFITNVPEGTKITIFDETKTANSNHRTHNVLNGGTIKIRDYANLTIAKLTDD